MIQLSNVSKFYYSKGVIATGFSRVSLDFSMGEFVAITGESGSGKSTLLNVISGLDTYEEGEMYIDGKETSHYTEKEFEDYRRKYIGNIFQNFNLVNSYTVYQNIELALLLNGAKPGKIKQTVNELIEKVGLTEYRNTKASKLSGGQKQRVAIARALAKDTPIIIADEPTGNLDKQSAEEVIRLLADVAKDKLVIIVTHNIEQVEPYITRKIKMHDGKVLEDVTLRHNPAVEAAAGTYDNMTAGSQIRIGIRNAFKIKPKFLLLLLVFLFVFSSLTAELSALRISLSDSEQYNYFFQDQRPNRIVVKKADNTSFTQEELQKIATMDQVNEVVESDVSLDNAMVFHTEGQDSQELRYYFQMTPQALSKFDGTLTWGKMPTKDTELLIVAKKNSYFASVYEELADKQLYLSSGQEAYTISGVALVDQVDQSSGNYDRDGYVYVSPALLKQMQTQSNADYATFSYVFNGKTYTSELEPGWIIQPLSSVKSGTCIMSEDYNLYGKNNKCVGSKLKIDVKTPYYTDSLTVTCASTYNQKTIKKLLGTSSEDGYSSAVIYVNAEDYSKLFDKDTYQISVLTDGEESVDAVNQLLQNNGYTTLAIKDAMVSSDGYTVVMKALTLLVTAMVAVVVFFVSYFVIRIIMRSRNVYYSTVRMLGGNGRVCRKLLGIDLLTVANMAAAVFAVCWWGLATYSGNETLLSMAQSMRWQDYLIIYLIGVVIAILVSLRYAKTLFKKSSISTLHEEV